MEITPNVHIIPGVMANPYLLIDPDGLTLVGARHGPVVSDALGKFPQV